MGHGRGDRAAGDRSLNENLCGGDGRVVPRDVVFDASGHITIDVDLPERLVEVDSVVRRTADREPGAADRVREPSGSAEGKGRGWIVTGLRPGHGVDREAVVAGSGGERVALNGDGAAGRALAGREENPVALHARNDVAGDRGVGGPARTERIHAHAGTAAAAAGPDDGVPGDGAGD